MAPLWGEAPWDEIWFLAFLLRDRTSFDELKCFLSCTTFLTPLLPPPPHYPSVPTAPPLPLFSPLFSCPSTLPLFFLLWPAVHWNGVIPLICLFCRGRYCLGVWLLLEFEVGCTLKLGFGCKTRSLHVALASLGLRDPTVSVSQVLGLKMWV